MIILEEAVELIVLFMAGRFRAALPVFSWAAAETERTHGRYGLIACLCGMLLACVLPTQVRITYHPGAELGVFC
uniref:Uncharacterized protein n=1 Tax=Arundo donax TaxID=35708 RepID=A0A0A9HI61_ARUDO